jgi:uncharacterized protein YbaR (Trm112 family)
MTSRKTSRPLDCMLAATSPDAEPLTERLRAAEAATAELESELERVRAGVVPPSPAAPLDLFTWSKAGIKLFLGERVHNVLKRAYRKLRQQPALDDSEDTAPPTPVHIPGRDRGLRATIAGKRLIDLLACPRCRSSELRESEGRLVCEACGSSFPVRHDAPTFLISKRDYVDLTAQTARTNPYSQSAKNLVLENAPGIVLDLGAGHPNDAELFGNVVRQEIIHYATTDVVSNMPHLPFRDEVFDAIICESVFEHVPDPWLTADEMYRVLKPGGKLRVDSAFLQPFHGDPNHFYNMTVPGLERTFRKFRKLRSGVDSHQTASFTIRIILKQYAAFVRNEVITQQIDRMLALPLEEVDGKLSQKQHQVIGAGVFFEGVKPPRQND